MHLITSNHAIELVKQKILAPEYPYIATPLSHDGPTKNKVMYKRYQVAVAVSAMLYQIGQAHYAPIVATYPPSLILKNPAASDFWTTLDKITLRKCDSLWVIMMEGWASSAGIMREINWWDEMVYDTGSAGQEIFSTTYQRPIRFYPLQAILDGNLNNFQIRKSDVNWLPQLPNT